MADVNRYATTQWEVIAARVIPRTQSPLPTAENATMLMSAQQIITEVVNKTASTHLEVLIVLAFQASI
jgi:hypothetical protein